ncbi:LysR family transcriptional regulator [Pseudomonas cannabina]|nr:LysR substrate-binding domain-containing protein [Pseudomonas cannabina]KAA8716115.1 LysR family transcriptional regulator [Pseudomonas cannabina]
MLSRQSVLTRVVEAEQAHRQGSAVLHGGLEVGRRLLWESRWQDGLTLPDQAWARPIGHDALDQLSGDFQGQLEDQQGKFNLRNLIANHRPDLAMVPDLNDVALFVQVVRSGSFAQAARQLGMPSNTVSRRIQQLEAQLDTRLLQRSTRKLALTPAGQDFYERCMGAVDGLTDAAEQLVSRREEPSGRVRIAATADFFDFFSMDWVADFLARYPRVQLEFVLSDDRADLIAERLDIAFRGGPLQDSGYVGRQLIDEERDCMVASPAYLATHGMPASLESLQAHYCVCAAHLGSFNTWRLLGPEEKLHEVQIASRFNANTAQALRKAALAGLGIALLPTTLIRADLRKGLLVPELAQYQRTSHGLHVLYPSRQHLPLAVSAFIGMVMEKLKTKAFPAQ